MGKQEFCRSSIKSRQARMLVAGVGVAGSRALMVDVKLEGRSDQDRP
jgi:hypothetical protein